MDPKETLRLFLMAVAEHDTRAAREHAHNLVGGLRAGGYAPQLPDVTVCTFETRNFTFQTIGASEDAAIEALRKGIAIHCAQTGADPDYFASSLDDADAYCHTLEYGACYRDGTKLRA